MLCGNIPPRCTSISPSFHTVLCFSHSPLLPIPPLSFHTRHITGCQLTAMLLQQLGRQSAQTILHLTQQLPGRQVCITHKAPSHCNLNTWACTPTIHATTSTPQVGKLDSTQTTNTTPLRNLVMVGGVGDKGGVGGVGWGWYVMTHACNTTTIATTTILHLLLLTMTLPIHTPTHHTHTPTHHAHTPCTVAVYA